MSTFNEQVRESMLIGCGVPELKNKIAALQSEIKLLKKSNKELRQRLTRASNADRRKLWLDVAEWLEEKNYSVLADEARLRADFV
jgi:uncharacterized small protein (DUF1192 family)